MFLVLGFTNVPDYMLYQLENLAIDEPLPTKPAGILVLGGVLNSRITRLRDIKIELSDGGERLIKGFELSNRFPGIPLVYSSGPPEATKFRDPETDVAKNIASALYGDTRNIVAENRSRNTWENAFYFKELLKPGPDDRWMIVTSAFHAARTRSIFSSFGLNFMIVPTDYRAEYSGGFELADNATRQIKKADLALKEITGIVAYTLMGRIRWPF